MARLSGAHGLPDTPSIRKKLGLLSPLPTTPKKKRRSCFWSTLTKLAFVSFLAEAHIGWMHLTEVARKGKSKWIQVCVCGGGSGDDEKASWKWWVEGQASLD